ncbi:MAG: hypothetical protein P1S60_17095 [Anaerolineae bacterium]|nr:hypothetical protein [Anaerolineae bacterium]
MKSYTACLTAVLLLREAGGFMTTISGKLWDTASCDPLLTATPDLDAKLRIVLEDRKR